MINEFFTTEISHVKNLNALHDLFYTPLKNNEIISKVSLFVSFHFSALKCMLLLVSSIGPSVLQLNL